MRIWTFKNVDEKAHTFSRRSKTVKKRSKTDEKRILRKFIFTDPVLSTIFTVVLLLCFGQLMYLPLSLKILFRRKSLNLIGSPETRKWLWNGAGRIHNFALFFVEVRLREGVCLRCGWSKR